MKTERESILVVLVAGIGDLVMASKSLRALRRGHPDAHIDLVTTSDAVPIAKMYPSIDRVWPFPIRELRTDKTYFLDVVTLLRRLRKTAYDFAVNLFPVNTWSGGLKMGCFFASLRANVKIGHDHDAFGLFVTRKVPPEVFLRHRVEAMTEVASMLGGVSDGMGLEIFWDRSTERECRNFFMEKESGDSTRAVVALNPGGDRRTKRWSPSRFAAVADKIADAFDARIVILGGPGDKDAGEEIRRRMRTKADNCAGKLSLPQLACFLNGCDLLITNDSGPMHIAAAVDTPTVALFGMGNPVLVRPYMNPGRYRIVYKDLDCQPCHRIKCRSLQCLNEITPDEVYEKSFELLTTCVQ